MKVIFSFENKAIKVPFNEYSYKLHISMWWVKEIESDKIP